MLNTVSELECYSPMTSKLLRRILEDYGLVITGWMLLWMSSGNLGAEVGQNGREDFADDEAL
jgi:hypothetical protein